MSTKWSLIISQKKSSTVNCKRVLNTLADCSCDTKMFASMTYNYLWSTDINVSNWEDTTKDRATWSHDIKKGILTTEAKRRVQMADKIIIIARKKRDCKKCMPAFKLQLH